MILGILQTGRVSDEARMLYGGYPEMFARLFEPRGFELRVWMVVDGEFPEGPDAADAWLITGSPHGVYEDRPWIAPLEALIREIRDAGRPLVGICFGHQLMARALGGEVVKSDRGWGVGLSFNRVTERADWMTPWQPGLDLLVSHQDQVERLPEGARVLGGSDFCPAYLMQVGEHFLGVQGHPEFTPAYSRDLMALRADLVGHHRVREGEASLSAPVDDTLMVRWILAFMRRAIERRGSASRAPS